MNTVTEQERSHLAKAPVSCHLREALELRPSKYTFFSSVLRSGISRNRSRKGPWAQDKPIPLDQLDEEDQSFLKHHTPGFSGNVWSEPDPTEIMKPIPPIRCIALLALTAFLQTAFAEAQTKTWIDPQLAAAEDPDFLIQGEYGSDEPGARIGVQVVALGDGKFEGYILEGGLPGLGWTRQKERTLLKGKHTDGGIIFKDVEGNIIATIADGNYFPNGVVDGKSVLPRIERKSPTLGAPAPEGAVVLFDGLSLIHI